MTAIISLLTPHSVVPRSSRIIFIVCVAYLISRRRALCLYLHDARHFNGIAGDVSRRHGFR